MLQIWTLYLTVTVTLAHYVQSCVF